MLPEQLHPGDWHFEPGTRPAAALADFAVDKSIYVAGVAAYDAYRAMLYALGARSVSNKMMAHVTTIVHGSAPPKAARTKYPNGEFIPASAVLPLFHQEVASFGDYIHALIRHGFRVRNPSDEGDPEFDHFSLPLIEDSLHATLLRYLSTSSFIRDFSTSGGADHDLEPDPEYVPFTVPVTDRPWYIRWVRDGWTRVHAQRGEGDYPLEIKGIDLTAVAPVVWTRSAGLYFNTIPNIDSVCGLFIQAGVNARTGLVDGVAISRVWT